ncbi:MAG: hypothetical protein HY720_25310 [Planctomycetes bacterium]|nr:hypothetical protein [Planctomycetota bacterium]
MFTASKLISAGRLQYFSRHSKRVSSALGRFLASSKQLSPEKGGFHSFEERQAFQRQIERGRAASFLHGSL